ncbi:MAG: hypothetical protein ABSG86_15260 [Thermoguttaceae bacterium]
MWTRGRAKLAPLTVAMTWWRRRHRGTIRARTTARAFELRWTRRPTAGTGVWTQWRAAHLAPAVAVTRRFRRHGWAFEATGMTRAFELRRTRGRTTRTGRRAKRRAAHRAPAVAATRWHSRAFGATGMTRAIKPRWTGRRSTRTGRRPLPVAPDLRLLGWARPWFLTVRPGPAIRTSPRAVQGLEHLIQFHLQTAHPGLQPSRPRHCRLSLRATSMTRSIGVRSPRRWAARSGYRAAARPGLRPFSLTVTRRFGRLWFGFRAARTTRSVNSRLARRRTTGTCARTRRGSVVIPRVVAAGRRSPGHRATLWATFREQRRASRVSGSLGRPWRVIFVRLWLSLLVAVTGRTLGLRLAVQGEQDQQTEQGARHGPAQSPSVTHPSWNNHPTPPKG